MKVNMADDKLPTPTVVFTTEQQPPREATTTAPAKSGHLTRKHVLWAVVSLVITGLVVTAVLVGIHLVTKGNEETLKLSLKLKDSNSPGTQQNISVDPSANIVVHHFIQNGLDVTVSNDFDKDIQLFKIVFESSVGCYVTPLNRSHALDLKSLNLPGMGYTGDTMNVSSTSEVDLIYDVAPTSINNTSFLGQRANALCNNVPVYWLKPTCLTSPDDVVPTSTSLVRKKRSVSCSCGWQTCKVCLFRRCVSFTCNYRCQCCLNSVCLTISATNPCAVCIAAQGFNLYCANICALLFKK